MIRNHRTPEGEALGEQIARLCDGAEPKARLRMPELQPRCASCAFRRGPHVANGSPATLMDALKCVMEGHEFQCHQPDRKGEPCSGWAMFLLARDESDASVVAPWPFSDEVEKEA